MAEDINNSYLTNGVIATLQVIGGKWKPIILYILLTEGTKRFGELRRMIPAITQGMLTSQLRELERDGMVVRRVYQEIPPKVEYFISEHGQTLSTVLNDMCGWGFYHIEQKKNKEKQDQPSH
ncbi:winged helix-turn-helix transcriptional regulator [Paenibacillus radicis (ex Gao et al. 2016)]|uniref:MarR family transcriptional regulator n=1 Tax=Paenibacillus radicis (ex Gao et al. 2016) TaxID=1737354 RepID=A0A917H1M6_9BACL|nr:helix-turn-helix domain-containing protein [Paenibacillus radicis (ex Gao et al. 2016)]GGG64681.1 MarR family transcriptional regulator [Paenibacillus radicis (ex Gao et al. 2016)]